MINDHLGDTLSSFKGIAPFIILNNNSLIRHFS
jgi:hypothetical protein